MSSQDSTRVGFAVSASRVDLPLAVVFGIDNQELVEMLQDVKGSLRPQRQEPILESEYRKIVATIKTHPPSQLRLTSPPPDEIEAHTCEKTDRTIETMDSSFVHGKKKGYHRTQVTKY